MQLVIISGGAANGLVDRLAPELRAVNGAVLSGAFGAVGLMRDKLTGGAPADLVILTKALISALEKSGHVVPGTARDLGVVATAIAVRKGDPLPLMGTSALLKEALLAADEVHVPDTRQSTAGQHIAKMFAGLGLAAEVAPRLKEHPNGMTAMAALAASKARQPIGCTQVTEIKATPGITMVRALPQPFELATTYTGAIATRAEQPGLAQQFLAMLTDVRAAGHRAAAGFERA